MRQALKNYFFDRGILVNEASEKGDASFEARFALAKLFNIRITEGENLVMADMIRYVSGQPDQNVPEPFYKGFPESVRELISEQRLWDQLLHYAHIYGMGDFSMQEHAISEAVLKRRMYGMGYYITFIIIRLMKLPRSSYSV